MNEFLYFARRCADDQLDVVSVLFQGLSRPTEGDVLFFEGDPWPTGRLRNAVAACQAWLAAEGLARGDRVAVMLKNSSDHVALIYALIMSGIVWIPVNTRLKSEGLRYLVWHSKPDLIVADVELAKMFDDTIRSECRIVHPLPCDGH